MDYITVEQFLEQSEKVQNSLRQWAELNLQKYDLAKPLDEKNIYMIDEIRDTRKDSIDIGKVFYLGHALCWDSIYELIPLFSEAQLRRFIEDKTGGKVDLAFFDEDKEHKGYLIEVWTYKPYERIKKFEYLSDDLLQAYWQVACMIAGESEG